MKYPKLMAMLLTSAVLCLSLLGCGYENGANLELSSVFSSSSTLTSPSEKGEEQVSSMPEASTAGLESEVSYTPEEKQELIEYGIYLLSFEAAENESENEREYTEREKLAMIACGEYLLTCENGKFPANVSFERLDKKLSVIAPELCEKVFRHINEVAWPAER